MTDDARRSLRFLILSASLREGSTNARLAALAASTIAAYGSQVDAATMSEFDTPSFNADVERDQGLPPGAEHFRERLVEAHAFVIASPEYNASMPGVVKNLIDWVSRFSPQPFVARQGLLMSASPSMSGGNRGLWSLRIPLEHLGARVYPEMFSLAQAHLAFDDDGGLADPVLAQRFRDTLEGFVDLVEASTHYPCVKRAWVEHLGEHPDLVFDRVERPVT